MPHITETTVTAATAAGLLAPGVRVAGPRFWTDDQSAHAALGVFLTADDVKTDDDEHATIGYSYYTEGGARKKHSVHWDADDVVAVVEMNATGGYAHHDDRLTLPGGYMDAHPGTSLRVWDVFTADGAPLAQGVTTAQGRALLAEHAPEMMWTAQGDGVFTARGHGRMWRIERGRRNPDFTAHTPLSRAWLLNVLSAPLGTDDWTVVAEGVVTLDDAKRAATAAAV